MYTYYNFIIQYMHLLLQLWSVSYLVFPFWIVCLQFCGFNAVEKPISFYTEIYKIIKNGMAGFRKILQYMVHFDNSKRPYQEGNAQIPWLVLVVFTNVSDLLSQCKWGLPAWWCWFLVVVDHLSGFVWKHGAPNLGRGRANFPVFPHCQELIGTAVSQYPSVQEKNPSHRVGIWVSFP